MSYAAIHTMSADVDLQHRILACAAQESIPYPVCTHPHYMRLVCAAPGWDAAWASAEANGVERPGWDGAVITDGMILARVQGLGASPL